MSNYINLIGLFKQFADKHPNVMRFKSDTKDTLTPFEAETEEFPILYIILDSMVPNVNENMYKSISYNFTLYCLVPRIDLIPDEDNNIMLNQTNVNIQTTSQIIRDFYQALKDIEIFEISGFNMNSVHGLSTSNLQGFTSYISVIMDDDGCIIPMDDLELPDFREC